ncbi:MAG: hypothetical protein KIT09_02580 [Bryobacteraceae bacterium]|nr:hypothetical protein [Bryobacteraceae bacterium]
MTTPARRQPDMADAVLEIVALRRQAVESAAAVVGELERLEAVIATWGQQIMETLRRRSKSKE